MPPEDIQTRVFSSRTSSQLVAEALGHELSRVKIRGMIDDYVGQVSFEELVMRYAGKEIERRSLGNIKFWAITILTTIFTAFVTALAALTTHASG
jgi:hypothetical protein